LMAASHQSMRDDYEISCRELDTMVEIAARQRGVYGARMTGGGFGGCTINFVGRGARREFQRRVSAEYESAIGLHPDIYICEASQGAELWETTADNLPKVTAEERRRKHGAACGIAMDASLLQGSSATPQCSIHLHGSGCWFPRIERSGRGLGESRRPPLRICQSL